MWHLQLKARTHTHFHTYTRKHIYNSIEYILQPTIRETKQIDNRFKLISNTLRDTITEKLYYENKMYVVVVQIVLLEDVLVILDNWENITEIFPMGNI